MPLRRRTSPRLRPPPLIQSPPNAATGGYMVGLTTTPWSPTTRCGKHWRRQWGYSAKRRAAFGEAARRAAIYGGLGHAVASIGGLRTPAAREICGICESFSARGVEAAMYGGSTWGRGPHGGGLANKRLNR